MLRKVLHTGATQLSGTVATVALGIVLARVLGPVGKGVTSYAVMILGLALVFFGGPMAAVMSQHAREKLLRLRVYAAALRATGLLALVVFAVLLALAFVFPTQRVLIAVALSLPAALYALLVKTLLLAEGRVASANVVDLVASLGYAVTASVIVLAGGGVVGALLGWSFSYGASAAVASVLLRKSSGREDSTREADVGALTRDQFVFGGKSGVVYAAGYLNLRIDSLVVAFVLGPAALGIYSVATATAEMLWKVSNAVGWTASGRIVGDSREEVRPLVGRLIRAIVAIELVLGGLAALAGPWLITLMYGQRFASAGLPLRLILFGIVAYAVEPILGYFLVVREQRPMMVLAIQGSSAVVCGVATFLLVPSLGLAGAAISTSATYLAVVALKGWLVARSLGAPVSELFVPRREDLLYLRDAARSLVSRGRPRPSASVKAA